MYMNFNYVQKKNLFFYIKLPFFSIFSLNLPIICTKNNKTFGNKEEKQKRARENSRAHIINI